MNVFVEDLVVVRLSVQPQVLFVHLDLVSTSAIVRKQKKARSFSMRVRNSLGCLATHLGVTTETSTNEAIASPACSPNSAWSMMVLWNISA